MAKLEFKKADGEMQFGFPSMRFTINGDGVVDFQRFDSPLRIRSKAASRKIITKYLKWSFAALSVILGFVFLFFNFWTPEDADQTKFISSAINVVSIALVGSIFGFGGVNLFSYQNQLAMIAQQVEENLQDSCPFEGIQARNGHDPRMRPGSPIFCNKCVLGIDITANEPGGLIHQCSVYDQMHLAWLELFPRYSGEDGISEYLQGR